MPSQSTSYQTQHIAAKSPPAFEFPKRKRWADLLLTELVDNIAFVISPACKIWFCGAPVTELLGWRDTDIIDLDFMDLLDIEDHIRFRESFNQAIQHGVEFDLVIKLKKCDSPIAFGAPVPAPGIVFSIKCCPYIAQPDPEIKCLIAMATPYPSRSTSILDTIIDLKAKQNRLQQRLAELQARAPPETSSHPGLSSQANSMYATSSLNAKNHGTGISGSDSFLSSGMGAKSLNDPSIRGFLDTNEFNSEESIDEGSKKKKMKRAQNAEQYVCKTCGRTDSPEWRKGPMGPKTLCNACGLRWAKQMRKDPTEEMGPSSALTDI